METEQLPSQLRALEKISSWLMQHWRRKGPRKKRAFSARSPRRGFHTFRRTFRCLLHWRLQPTLPGCMSSARWTSGCGFAGPVGNAAQSCIVSHGVQTLEMLWRSLVACGNLASGYGWLGVGQNPQPRGSNETNSRSAVCRPLAARLLQSLMSTQQLDEG